MSIEWIKMRKCLLTDPRVVRIMSACKADRLQTIGGLFAAWCLFDQHTVDGMLPGYTPEVLDAIVQFPGLANAMISVGWLEYDPKSGLKATNFAEHNGQTAKRRAQESVRKMSARDADKKRTRSYSISSSNKDIPVDGVSGKSRPVGKPELVSQELWDDYLTVRKAKRAGVVTKTALAGLVRESGKAGISLEDAIQICVERGWQSFKAEWYTDTKPAEEKPMLRFEDIKPEDIR